ncbi:AMP-binding protein [Paramaledivibacter caminithermalis]|jgi:fatty-acyl-CoA synthase|uniref:Fatty-acyl-CoA synthase n=1 Tax=Paramaledivibacter caminithermalis (strain DSM 15212 / CIP 107654 / DViRD3) TaxID=1121301 RepID=A0A1M6MCZ8_PARC5|nr:AMP-binding protein [Paramaledivibacter caminithermalis]SHJ81325.1 fatty-acyl-CoA synthase [Paramaledivibacter caminithermalis DSM 15212]
MKNCGWIGNYSYFRARISPNKEAVYDLDNDIHYTYYDLENRSNIVANYLAEKLNVTKGDRVAFITRNCVELIDAYYATSKLGAILVPYNARLSINELEQLIKNESPKILFYEEIFKDTVNELKKRVEISKYIVLLNAKEKTDDLHYEEIINYENDKMRFCSELDFEDAHLIIHTGGTTGLPKGAMISHRAMLFNSINEVITWNISHNDSAHILLPLFHTGGWNLLTLPLLHAGGRIIINKQFDPKLALKIINDEKPTFVFGAATIFRMMINLPEFETTDFSSVKWIMAGAAPTPINIMQKFWNKGIRFVLGYGMTEAGPNNLTAPAEFMDFEQIKEKYASVGKPMYFTQAKIVDNEGNEVGIDEPGELIWSGPQIFSGYWNNEEETKKTLIDGWVYTGDMAIKDKDGFFYIVGRKKNMFISGGENVFPPEIEKILYDFPEIHEVCVIGVPDEKWGEVGKAVITLKPNKKITKKEIIDRLSMKLAHYKVPKYVQFINEIPKNNVGKIVRAKILEYYGKAED